MASGIYDALGVIADFEENVNSSDTDRYQIIKKHLKMMDTLNYRIPEFRFGLEWLNVSQPLTLTGDLHGQIVILDFFTYCCINCVHILPDLEETEKMFPPQSGVAVVGVHSAKFMNEKITANILSAVLRYNIKHPVVNDQDATLWQELAVSCWPTLVFVGPSGQLIYSLAGEGHRAWIMEFLKVATEHYSSQLTPRPLALSLEKNKTPESSLCFPGKVCYWQEKDWLVITDTGNHRIVVANTSGVVQVVVGSGQSGLKDGNFAEAEFNSPQGVACNERCIYVADTSNHCLRQIDFSARTVITVAGTGKQGTDYIGGRQSTQQEIASPWDLTLGTSPRDPSSPVLFVAMAGTHQIWVYFVTDSTWYQGKSYTAGTCICFAGSGQEENRNNSYPERAGFAQPSGLALSKDDQNHSLYIADSESSSIRAISLVHGKVKGLAGGEKDPKNLFAYGDTDGIGTVAKLQHPLGVAYLDGKLVVADSYNHKIKLVDVNTLDCQTYAGTGQPGNHLEASDLRMCVFNEPGGVAVNENRKIIYIADTNNHTIKGLDFATSTAFQLPIIFPEGLQVDSGAGNDPDETSGMEEENAQITLPEITTAVSQDYITVTMPLKLNQGEHINTLAPNSWMCSAMDEAGKQLWNSLSSSNRKGKLQLASTHKNSSLTQASLTISLPQSTSPGRFTLKITTQTFKCLDNDDVCLPPELTHFTQVLNLI